MLPTTSVSLKIFSGNGGVSSEPKRNWLFQETVVNLLLYKKRKSGTWRKAQGHGGGTRYPKKSYGYLQQGPEIKYRFIEKNRSAFPVNKMCQTLEITPSGFYRWKKGLISKQKRENEGVKSA
jgi:hypothetical protein